MKYNDPIHQLEYINVTTWLQKIAKVKLQNVSLTEVSQGSGSSPISKGSPKEFTLEDTMTLEICGTEQAPNSKDTSKSDNRPEISFWFILLLMYWGSGNQVFDFIGVVLIRRGENHWPATSCMMQNSRVRRSAFKSFDMEETEYILCLHFLNHDGIGESFGSVSQLHARLILLMEDILRQLSPVT